MSVIAVPVAEWEGIVDAGAVAVDASYTLSDTAENISALPAQNIIAPLTKIQSTSIDVALVLNLDLGVAILNADQEAVSGPHLSLVTAPTHQLAVLADAAASRIPCDRTYDAAAGASKNSITNKAPSIGRLLGEKAR